MLVRQEWKSAGDPIETAIADDDLRERLGRLNIFTRMTPQAIRGVVARLRDAARSTAPTIDAVAQLPETSHN